MIITSQILNEARNLSEGRDLINVFGSDLLYAFHEILIGPYPDRGLERLQETGVIRYLFPELQAIVGFGGGVEGHKDLWDHTKKVVRQCRDLMSSETPDYLLWAALFHDIAKVPCFKKEGSQISFHGHEILGARMFRRIADRTKMFDSSAVKAIAFIVENLGRFESYSADWTDSGVRRLYRDTKDHWESLCTLAKADITTKYAEKRTRLQKEIDDLYRRALEIDRVDNLPSLLPSGLGNVLMREFDLPQGRLLGLLMDSSKQLVESGTIPQGAPAEAFVEYWLKFPTYIESLKEHVK